PKYYSDQDNQKPRHHRGGVPLPSEESKYPPAQSALTTLPKLIPQEHDDQQRKHHSRSISTQYECRDDSVSTRGSQSQHVSEDRTSTKSRDATCHFQYETFSKPCGSGGARLQGRLPRKHPRNIKAMPKKLDYS